MEIHKFFGGGGAVYLSTHLKADRWLYKIPN